MNNSDNNSNSNSEPNAADAELENVASFQWTKIFRVFKFRIPLWAVAIVVVVVGGWFGYSGITSQEPVNLRPAINDAKKVTIEIFTCDEQIDENNLNIRQEELSLQNKFEDVENVGDANVRITRDQKLCGDTEKQK